MTTPVPPPWRGSSHVRGQVTASANLISSRFSRASPAFRRARSRAHVAVHPGGFSRT